MITRRSLLGLAAASLSTGVAGCSVVGTADSIRLGEFTASNYCEEPHTLHLSVEDGDDEVYREVVALDAAPDDPDERVSFAQEVPPQPPTDAGEYRIYARLDDEDEWDEANAINRDASCIEMDFQVRCYGNRDPHLTMMGAVLNPTCPQDDD